jgi:hypothetical protein
VRVRRSTLVHDRADLAKEISAPMLVLWGTHSGQGSGYDLLKVWRDHAGDVHGHGIASGHFIPEEQPDRVYAALKDFFRSNPMQPEGFAVSPGDDTVALHLHSAGGLGVEQDDLRP